MLTLLASLFPATAGGNSGEAPWRRRLGGALVDFAALVGLGLLTVLWASDAGVPSIVWITLATLAIIGAVATIGPLRIADMRLTLLFVAFALVYAAGMSISYFFIVESHPGRHDLYIAQFAALILGAIAFVFGAVAARLRRWIGFALALFCVAIFAMVAESDFAMPGLIRRYGPDDVIAGFQQMGDAVIVCSLVIATRVRRPILVYLLAALCIGLLLMIPSRSSIVLGALAMMTICVISSPARIRLFLVAIALVAAIMVRLIVTTPLDDSVGMGRATAGASDGRPAVPAPAAERGVLTAAEGAAQQERERIFDGGLDAIAEHPIAGWFGFQLDAFNRPGMHMRNLLDGWAQAGVLPFVAFLLFWAVLIRQWYLSFLVDRELANRVLPMLLFPALAWLMSRHVNYPLLYFCVGFYAAILPYGFEDRMQGNLAP